MNNDYKELQKFLQQEIENAKKNFWQMCGLNYEHISNEKHICSQEELYKKYGQYDNNSVELELKEDSESYRKYGELLHGTLKYSCEERAMLQAAIEMNPMPKTYGNVKFELSSLNPNLDDQLIIELDRDGLPISDIEAIVSVPINLKNAFVETGQKQITNVLKIETDISAEDELNFMYGIYEKLIEHGRKLQLWEAVELIALIKYKQPETLTGQLKELSINPQLQAIIRYKFLQFKKQVEGLTEQENNEYLSLQLARGRKRFYLLEKELQRSGVKFRNLPDKLKGIYSNFLMFFECQHIRIYPPIVWIDFERAMHIVVRHMQGMQAKGKFESKTPIRYDYKDLINLIRIVVNKVEDQIELEFRTKPDKTFIRKNARAIEYNGNYYRLEIEANGRLLTFHPYN